MIYNIHPIFVHFPIAMLFVYSLVKVIPLNKWFTHIAWRDIERILLLIGVLGAFAALATGEAAEHIVRPNHALVENHAFFGSLATLIFGILLVGEIAALIRASSISNRLPIPVQKIISFLDRILTGRTPSIIIAILGFIAICITGMLGGIITYGTTADPLAPVLLRVLGITL